MRILPLIAMAFCLQTTAAAAQSSESDPPQPIRIWGPPAMRGALERWAEAYRAVRPEAAFELTLKGSDTAIPGLYGGQADIAVMGRRNDIVDDNGFSRTMERPFVRLQIANGSVSVPGKSDAFAILVNAANPLSVVTLDQIASVIDCARPRTASTWGDLGVNGDWADRPISVYAYDFSTRSGRHFQHLVTGDSRRMCWNRIVEFADARELDGTVTAAAERAGAAARADPDALVIANAAQARDGLRLLPVASRSGSPGFIPDADTIISGRYPLAREVYAFVNRPPEQGVPPHVVDFLTWALGPGQALLDADEGYLPLSSAEAARTLETVQGLR